MSIILAVALSIVGVVVLAFATWEYFTVVRPAIRNRGAKR